MTAERLQIVCVNCEFRIFIERYGVWLNIEKNVWLVGVQLEGSTTIWIAERKLTGRSAVPSFLVPVSHAVLRTPFLLLPFTPLGQCAVR